MYEVPMLRADLVPHHELVQNCQRLTTEQDDSERGRERAQNSSFASG
jgi:hypothetical protein